MRKTSLLSPLRMSLLAALVLSFGVPCTPAYAGTREIEIDQARTVVLAVASYDRITIDDRTVVLNSMDTRTPAGFLPGYFSFSIIRESDSSARPDETIRMYAVSKKTGDTWEMNLCTHYSFPGLQKIQQEIKRQTGATSEDDLENSKAIGCSSQAQAKTP